MNRYFHYIKIIVDLLVVIYITVSDFEFIQYIVSGINKDYEIIVTVVIYFLGQFIFDY